MTIKKTTILIILGVLLACGLTGFGCWAVPKWNVYSQEMSGKAKLAEAESSRQIAILEAKAKQESAKMLAVAEVERAKGVAQANQIIGESLKGNESYLRYLWIQGLQDGSSEVIYIPTEANMPILEARDERPTPKAEKAATPPPEKK